MEHKEYIPHPESNRELIERLLRPTPEVVVISGGPCGGKTTLLEGLPAAARRASRPLTIMPEVATRFMEDGFDFGYAAQHDRGAYLDAQRAIIDQELTFIERSRRRYAGSDALIVLDRGISDTYGYMTSQEAQMLASEYGKTPLELGYDVTDKVVYMPSIAVHAPARYDALKGTNPTRYEDSAKEAAATCQRTIAQWAQHPELHVVSGIDFADSLRRATGFVLGGEQEYERKWHVSEASAQALIAQKTDSNEMLSLTCIVQSYGDIGAIPIRLRRGYTQGGYEFFHFAVKHKTAHGNVELRRTITRSEYEALQRYTPESLTKTRYAFMHEGQVWHADALPYQLETLWFFEAEVAYPDDFRHLRLPLPAKKMHPSQANTRAFAANMR